MPRKPNPLREQIERLAALVKADRAERRAAEKPLRATRRALSERLRSLHRSKQKASASRERMLRIGHIPGSESDAEWIHGQLWRDNQARVAQVTSALTTTEAELAAFDTQHPELTT